MDRIPAFKTAVGGNDGGEESGSAAVLGVVIASVGGEYICLLNVRRRSIRGEGIPVVAAAFAIQSLGLFTMA